MAKHSNKMHLGKWLAELSEAAKKSRDAAATEYIGSTSEEARENRIGLALELLEDAQRLRKLIAADGGTPPDVASLLTLLSTAELSGRLTDITQEIWASNLEGLEEEDEG